jgi:ATP-binding cassette, subfamily A (ABC1), member 3
VTGAGKSTLAWVMAGLLEPTSGDCLIHGLSLYAASTHQHVGVGFCPQGNILYDNLTVRYHLEFFAKLHGAVYDKKAIERRARAVGLQDNLHAQVHTLSQGNKRKLSFAIARYGRRFGAMILDEPMAGQDIDSRKLCWRCMQKDKESCAIVMVTHNVKEAEQRADR